MSKFYIRAREARENDVLCFGNPKREIRVERVSHNSSGRIGIHANSDTWTAYFNPNDRVRIKARAY
ncbi:hypothetical protein [Delftia sp. JD2]|uniref:hypothetical protein n=1 Tax=Delftia sp. JD2 TaxID=469553 RepID=UPI001111CEA3|nr:hypothetical protein [Delftia sp. JD2]